MNKQQELTARWDAFLSKIEQRFAESLEEGKSAVLDSLDENGYDYYSSFRILTSIKNQIEDSVIGKIDTTWHNQVEPLMAADGDYWMDEMHKGYNLRGLLHTRLTEWQFVCEGLASEKYYAYAIQLVNKDFRCSQCGSPIEVKKDFFLSQYVTCSYCNAVNTFVPETKYVQIGWNVVDNIAAYSALEEWRTIQNLQNNNRHNDSDKYRQVYNEACRKYLNKYFEKRIELMPHTKNTYEKDFKKELDKMAIN